MCELVLVSIGHTDKSLRVSARVCEPTTLIRMLIDNEIKRDVTVEFFFFLPYTCNCFQCKMLVNSFCLFSLGAFCWDLKCIVLDMAATCKLRIL